MPSDEAKSAHDSKEAAIARAPGAGVAYCKPSHREAASTEEASRPAAPVASRNSGKAPVAIAANPAGAMTANNGATARLAKGAASASR